jgi:phosphoribosyl-ATP pyrophosphohydrolase/phosphoribosyl-AMP cyclohydrolase
MNIEDLDFEKGNGLIPAVIQDANSFQVLMLGYMNKEALQLTLEKERVTFYSRTKERLWTKGETSGNYLDLIDIQEDCDNDTLLILAEPKGPTCHTGEKSCFHQKEFKPENNLAFLEDLEQLIISRKKELPEGSYTTSLFEEGLDRITQKVGEEAVETIIEAKNDDHNLVNEVSDLIYHLLVLLVKKEVSFNDVIQNLKERHQK